MIYYSFNLFNVLFLNLRYVNYYIFHLYMVYYRINQRFKIFNRHIL
jgi:hypothetical protein